jgi:hypothetical protein
VWVSIAVMVSGGSNHLFCLMRTIGRNISVSDSEESSTDLGFWQWHEVIDYAVYGAVVNDDIDKCYDNS